MSELRSIRIIPRHLAQRHIERSVLHAVHVVHDHAQAGGIGGGFPYSVVAGMPLARRFSLGCWHRSRRRGPVGTCQSIRRSVPDQDLQVRLQILPVRQKVQHARVRQYRYRQLTQGRPFAHRRQRNRR
jgi:hypothetical protein